MPGVEMLVCGSCLEIWDGPVQPFDGLAHCQSCGRRRRCGYITWKTGD